jgi:hypothetical protein
MKDRTVEHLLCKHEALSSNPSPVNNNKKICLKDRTEIWVRCGGRGYLWGGMGNGGDEGEGTGLIGFVYIDEIVMKSLAVALSGAERGPDER